MEWKYYNHAMVPKGCEPNEVVDTSKLQDGTIWKAGGGTPLLARWTSDFDCGVETNWWYVIKDDEYDIRTLKAKRRYEITKARKNFEVRVIDPQDYCDAMIDIQIEKLKTYPEKYRPSLERSRWDFKSWNGTYFGAFRKDEDGVATELCGFSLLSCGKKQIYFSLQTVLPEKERDGINAALVDGILTHFQKELSSGMYICDGARNLYHETYFQDYLEKYFGFRKAYCKLHIVYRPCVRWVIPILYVFRNFFKRLDHISVIHSINAVMRMEEISRGV